LASACGPQAIGADGVTAEVVAQEAGFFSAPEQVWGRDHP